MSESERMPGIAEQVPGAADRVARLEDREASCPGSAVCRWQAAPMPERPAPTIRTSTCSTGTQPTSRSPLSPSASRPCAGAGSGKPAGWARRSRASQRAAASADARARRRAARASGGRWWRAQLDDAASSAPSATISSAMTRWKRPASECGQGRAGARSRGPRSESVQAALTRAARCRRAPSRGSGRAAARGRTRAATGARPRADPVVVLVVVGEAGGAVAQRAAVRVRRQPLEHERAERAARGVAGGEQRPRRSSLSRAARRLARRRSPRCRRAR